MIRRHDGPDVLFDLHLELGEGPSWDAAAGRLSFVDILAGKVYVANPERVIDVLTVGAHVGAALPATGGGYLLARRDGFVRLESDGTAEPLALPLRDLPDLRFNDGKCDPAGRAWAGTMPYEQSLGRGVLYRLQGGEAVEAVTGVGLSNGLGWSPDSRTMYFVDTWAARIDAFDFDAASGTLGARRTLVDLAGAEGVPDGLCVDGEGCLWVAAWDGWEVRRYAPDGRGIGFIRLPVSRPTSCCFVDDWLVITSAAHGLDDDDRSLQPHAGAVFAIRPGVSGPGATRWIPTGRDRPGSLRAP
ncbi:MAG TPA: SMP-30/gluconolactonase/LRE family protein [Candidatus Limnocylindrales bacterium]